MKEHWQTKPGWNNILPNRNDPEFGDFWDPIERVAQHLNFSIASGEKIPTQAIAELSFQYFTPQVIGRPAEVTTIDESGVATYSGELLGILPDPEFHTLAIGLLQPDSSVVAVPLFRQSLCDLKVTQTEFLENTADTAAVVREYSREISRLMASPAFLRLGIEHQRQCLLSLICDLNGYLQMMVDDDDIAIITHSPENKESITLSSDNPHVIIAGLDDRTFPFSEAFPGKLEMVIPYGTGSSTYTVPCDEISDFDFGANQAPLLYEDLLSTFFEDPNIRNIIHDIESHLADALGTDEEQFLRQDCIKNLDSILPEDFFSAATFSVSGIVHRINKDGEQSSEYETHEDIQGRDLTIEFLDGRWRVVLKLDTGDYSHGPDSTILVMSSRDNTSMLMRKSRAPHGSFEVE